MARGLPRFSFAQRQLQIQLHSQLSSTMTYSVLFALISITAAAGQNCLAQTAVGCSLKFEYAASCHHMCLGEGDYCCQALVSYVDSTAQIILLLHLQHDAITVCPVSSKHLWENGAGQPCRCSTRGALHYCNSPSADYTVEAAGSQMHHWV